MSEFAWFVCGVVGAFAGGVFTGWLICQVPDEVEEFPFVPTEDPPSNVRFLLPPERGEFDRYRGVYDWERDGG